MPLAVSVTAKGNKQIEALMNRLSPERNPRPISRSLIKCALLTQKITAEEMIIKGGRKRGKPGPKGGKGKLFDVSAKGKKKLTSRSGGLRGSLRIESAIERGSLPKSITFGTDKVYGPIHEFGGTIRVTKKMRAALHFQGIHLRKSTSTLTIPARPFMAPGLAKASKQFSKIFVVEINKEIAKQ